jgi:4-hydroxy-tetrahydrodipicolinate synthase
MPSVRRDILTAIPVAFHRDGSLDLPGSRSIVEMVANSGVQGAFILGTTGEFPSLSLAERGAITRMSLEHLGDLNVVVHVGAASRFEVVALINQARELGARHVAVLTPYYLPATRPAIIDFYRGVAAASDGLDVFVYIFAARTGNAIDAELLRTLSEIPNIVGAKVSGESLEQVRRYRDAVGPDFQIFTGADADLAKAAEYGAQGVVSGVASVLPRPFIELVAALEGGIHEEIERAQRRVEDAVTVIAGDPARIKAGLRLQGVNAGYVRMPIEEPSPAELAEIERAITEYA